VCVCVCARAWQSVPDRKKRTETANRRQLKSLNVDGIDTPFCGVSERVGFGGVGQEIFRKQRMSARCRALHLQTVIDFNFWVLRSSSEVQAGVGGLEAARRS
jgi:hypothetical protein